MCTAKAGRLGSQGKIAAERISISSSGQSNTGTIFVNMSKFFTVSVLHWYQNNILGAPKICFQNKVPEKINL